MKFGHQQQLLRVCKCSRIRIGGGGSSHTLRNLLWATRVLPIIHHNDDYNNNNNDDRAFGKNKDGNDDDDNDDDNNGEGDEKYCLCSSFRLTSCGYVLFNDEDDGYRVFWINSNSSNSGDDHYDRYDYVVPPGRKFEFKIKPQRDDIVEHCLNDTFEEMYVDPITGYTVVPQPPSSLNQGNINAAGTRKSSPFQNICGVRVILEAYLHVDALLSDIIHRRFGFVNLPDFYYNIVSFNSSSGRSVTLVLTFANPRRQQESGKSKSNGGNLCGNVNVKSNKKATKRPGASPAASLALFVEIDLFDQSYSEHEWLQHPSKSDSTFLREWSKKLVIHKRMVEMRMGPFCVADDLSEKMRCLNSNLGVKTFESYNNHGGDDCENEDGNGGVFIYNEKDDIDAELWEPFVLQKLHQQQQRQQRRGMKAEAIDAPKDIAMSSLYKFCDVITNDAVVNRTPVSHISSRDFPLQICYGA